MKENTVLKYFAMLLIFCVFGCVTNDTVTGVQPGDVSMGRGLFVEAPPLIASDISIFPQLSHNGVVWNVALSPDDAYIISADYNNGFVYMWEIQSGRLLRTFWGHDSVITTLAYNPDGKTFVSGDENGNIKIWDSESGKELHALSGHSWTISSLGYSPDGKRIVSSSFDRTITIWDAETGTELYVFGENNEVASAVYSPDGRYIVSSSSNSLVIWDAGNGRKYKVLAEGESPWWASWSRDGKKIVSVNDGGIISVWDAESGRKINSFESGRKEMQKAVFLSENSIVSWSYQGGINTWNTETGQKIRTINHSHDILGDFRIDGRHSVYMSSDGRFLVAGWNYTISLIDYNTGEDIQEFTGKTTFRQFVHFSPSTQQISIIRFDIGNQSVFILENAKLQSHDFKFSPPWIADGAYSWDGKRLVTTQRMGNTIRIHDAKNGERITQLYPHV